MAAVTEARDEFVEGMGAITEFWGAGRHTGRLWAVLYLSERAMSMDELGNAAGITKGHVSTNLRTLLRLGMVNKINRPGDRRDWYVAEPDIWKVARGVLRERGQVEFDRALASTDRALDKLRIAGETVSTAELEFLKRRIEAVREFNASVDRAVDALLRLDDLRTALSRLIDGRRR
jgi:DNA-binding transcriptional regulator GbsR (MarR family)